MRNKKKTGNYLDFIPAYQENIPFEISKEGEVTLLVENRGFFNRLAQLIFRKPKISKIHLDRMGNFIWPLIDGEKSLFELAELVKQEFGEKAEPLYPRLAQYFKNLESYGFVLMKEKPETAKQ